MWAKLFGRGSDDSHWQRVLSHYPEETQGKNCPSLSYIINYSVDLASQGWHSDRFESVVAALSTVAKIGARPVDVLGLIYGLGVAQLEDCKSDYASEFFKWCIGIDETYHPAYNRMGDYCYLHDRLDEAIGWYRSAIRHASGPNGEKHSASLGASAYIGDSLLKVGLCLVKKRERDHAPMFVSAARKWLDSSYRGYEDFGFASWSDIERLT